MRTQLQQVLHRDVHRARWLLAGFVLMLVHAAWEGRRLLVPAPFVSDDPWAFPGGGSVHGVTGAHLLTFGLAAVLALGFAPLVGAVRPDTQAWRTLPITPRAVWLARVVWVALGVLLTAVTTWLTLLPVPVPAALRLEIATSVAASTATLLVTGALLAVVAGSLRALVFGALAVTIAVLIGFSILMASASGVYGAPVISAGTLGFTTPAVLVLAVVALLLLAVLLGSRRVRWPLRTGVALVASYLLLANWMRVPVPAPPAPPVAPTNLAGVISLDARYAEQATGDANSLGFIEPGRGGYPVASHADIASGLAPRLDDANRAGLERPIASERNTVKLWLQLETPETPDRVVWRPRAATVRSGAQERPFLTVGTDVVLANGNPLPERRYRPLNQEAVSIPSAVAFARDDAAGNERANVAANETANERIALTVDVERQQPTLLALVPLDGSAASGPWAPFVTYRVIDSASGPPTVGVRLTQLFASRLEGRTRGGPDNDLTFALVHPARAELLHLSPTSRVGGDRPWSLNAGLIHLKQMMLQVVDRQVTRDTTARESITLPDASWYREASLAVIGWRVVERGAIEVDAPVREAMLSQRAR